MTIEVKLDYQGTRSACVACGGVIEKFEWRGAFGQHKFLCRDCMVSNDLPARLRLEAAAVREDAASRAAWIESLAAETWSLPTEAELAQADADREADWRAEAEVAAQEVSP